MKIKKRLLSILLSLVLVLGLTAVMVLGAVPIEGLVMVAHADEKVLSGSMNETANDGDVLTGSTSGRVTIESGAKITLRKVTITGGIVCNGSAEITLVGTNKVTGTNGTNGANDNGAGTDGIKINGILTIKGDGSLTATGGEGAKSNGAYVDDGGHGIVGALVVERDSASITAIGGKGKNGGDGIRLELDPTKEYSEKAALKVAKGSPIIQATGGNATDGNGGRGISSGTEAPNNCYALLIASGSPQITSTGGNSTSGKAGDGIYGPVTITTDSDNASVLAIHGDGKDAYAISGATTVSAGFAAFNRMSEDAPWKIDSDINGDQTTTITREHFVIENKYGRIFKSYCSVVLEGNGGSGIIVDPMYYELDDTMTLPANTYVRSKYSFTGWNTKEDGSGTPYADGAAITLSAGAIELDEFKQLILYAQWEKYPDPVITKSPAVISGLVYNGKAQELVTAGEATGGEMRYALGTATEATEPYTTSIPAKTDAGTYYVWYKAVGDDNHNDSDPTPLTVTISPVDKTKLKEAIAGAGAYLDTIKDRAEYADAAAALKKAIDAATAVAEDDNVTESAVAQATVDANGALDKAKADVAAIDKQAADEAAAKAVADAIDKLPAEAGLDDKEAVEAARAAYDALSDEQKALVPEDAVKKLADAEAQVKAAEADEAAAQGVIEAIDKLPNPAGTGDKAAVEAARKAYDALSDEQKALVPEDAVKKLADAEAQVKAAEADEAAAQGVIEAISALPAEDGLDDKAAVEAARAAYDALTEEQKALVPEDVVKKLTDAEEQVQAAEEAAETISIKKCKITVKNRAYTGKAVRKPVVTVMYGKVKLKEGRDYTLTYNKKAKQIGTYKLIVEGKGNYKGSRNLTFKIVPKGTAFTKLTGGKKQITLKWKQRKNIRGYQIQYSLKKNFSGGKKVTVKAGTLIRTIKKLKAGKKYYVRIRTYAKVKGKVYYSAWSKAKAVKTVSAKGNAPEQGGGEPGGDAQSEPGIEGLGLGAELALPGIEDAGDAGIVADEETEMVME